MNLENNAPEEETYYNSESEAIETYIEPLHQMELTEIEADEIQRGLRIDDLLSIEWE